MNIQKLLLCLYPSVWRARYEEEFLDVLASRPFSFSEGVDVVRGAIDAHLHPCLGTTTMPAPERIRQLLFILRRSLLTTFCAYSGFIVAGIAFQKLNEYHGFIEAAQTHSLVGFSFYLVVIGAVAALLALLVGGVPIVGAVVKDAFVRKHYGLLLLFATPIFAVVVFVGTVKLLEALVPVESAQLLILLSRGIFLATFFGAIVVSTGTVCYAVARSEISAKLLRFAVLPSFLMTLSMTVMLVATFVWGLSLWSSVPQLFNSNEGMFGTSTAGGWFKIVLVMGIATALATLSLVRSISARSTLSPSVP
jgi:hypothetical protein